MRFRMLHAMALAVGLVLAAQQALAEGRNLRAGYTAFPPYSFDNPDGGVAGYGVDIVTAAAGAMGDEVTFVRYDNPGELIAALADGEIDLTVLLAITQARSELGAFTRQISEFVMELSFADPPPPGVFERRFDGLKVAVSPGSFPDRVLATIPEVTAVYYDTISERLIALLSGEVDAVAGPGYALERVAGAAGLSAMLSIRRVGLASAPNALLVDRGDPELVADLDAFVAAAQADGTIEAIYGRWFAPVALTPREWAVKNLGALLWVFSGVVAVLGGAVTIQMVVNRARRREAARTQTIVEAFDLARAGIAIFDEELRAEASNAAFDAAFPDQARGIREGKRLPDMLREACAAGHFGDPAAEDTREAQISAYVDRLRRGEATETTVHGPSGQVFSRRGIRLSGGRVALVQTDVTELEESRKALAGRATALKLANDQLEAFARVAAHDLKSPAASAATLLDWVADDLARGAAAPPEGVLDTIDQARQLLRRQATLIGDLLAYARAADGAGTAVSILPADRIEEVLELIECPPGFSVAVQPNLPSVSVEPAAFDLVMRNLISNAIKHHDRDRGRITVRALREGAKVAFEVTDDGPGIPEAHKERVFEPFFKLRSHEEVAGSGLGLSMIRAAVLAWGGTIALRGNENGRGTVVRFTTPASADQQGQDGRAAAA
ncbi:MAG: transporter substrate-binding domain-containing protein [Paracoccaceae bacterium]|nr:transporter substrate-binding domain-containing protein [Paracoccaceae bacterium]